MQQYFGKDSSDQAVISWFRNEIESDDFIFIYSVITFYKALETFQVVIFSCLARKGQIQKRYVKHL